MTEQRAAKQLLQTKHMVLQSLLDNFPGAVSLIDSQLRFVVWNKELLRMLDFDEQLFPADNPPFLPDLYRYNLERGEYGNVDKEKYLQMITERARRFEPHVFERTRPNGMVLEIRGSPIVNGGFVTTYQDVTERHRIEEKLRRQSVLLQAVLENLPQGICVFDEKLRLELWNSGLVEMLGMPAQAFAKGVDFEDLLRLMASMGEVDNDDAERDVAGRMKQIRQFREHRYERTNTQGKTHLIQGKPVSIDGQVAVFITTLTDITDRKQAEMAQRLANTQLEKLVKELQETRADLVRSEKLAALGALVAGVAHELNTPLGNSLLMASALQDATGMIMGKLELGGVMRSDLSVYLEEAADASSLIMRNLTIAAELIIRFKQIAIDQAGAERGVFRLGALCSDTVALLQEKIEQSGHAIDIIMDEGIEMDSFPGPLEQVIANLVNNALLHAYEGRRGGHMRLSAQIPANRSRVLLEFNDDGCGIPSEIQDRIFDPFFTTKIGRGGTGLGLSISYNIITSLLGGQVSVHSVAGRGTSFLLDLPLIAPQQEDDGRLRRL
ncbi:MAG: PAS-domain containing protein [Burkholderiales bacterium]|nr:PAS-domain containing protein [Burkholderiales bacterium]